MLAHGAVPSVMASQASPPRLILSAQAAHSCGLHPQDDSRQLFTQPRRPLPGQGPGAGDGLSCSRGLRGRMGALVEAFLSKLEAALPSFSRYGM